MLVICSLLSCKKDQDKILTSKNWFIQSVTVTPAITFGNKTSKNYLELMGPESCAANSVLSFSSNGIFSSSSAGALCDQFIDPNKPAITWRRDGDQIFLSTSSNAAYTLKGDILTQVTSSTQTGATIYTFVSVYKSK